MRKSEASYSSEARSFYLKNENLRDTDELFQNENSQEFNSSLCSKSDCLIKYFINKRWKYVYKDEIKNFERLK